MSRSAGFEHKYEKRRGRKFLLRDRFEYAFKEQIEPGWQCGGAEAGRCECCDEPACIYRHRLYCLTAERMIVCAGYAWDGASGPAINTRNSLRATLVHDVLYQSMREGGLRSAKDSRKWADREFLLVLKEDGMLWPRRRIWHGVVRAFGKPNAKPHPWVACLQAGDPQLPRNGA